MTIVHFISGSTLLSLKTTGKLHISFMQKRLCLNGLYRVSYMSAHVLLNLLSELGKRDKMGGLPSILSLFRNEFNKFNKARARILESIYHMALRLP